MSYLPQISLQLIKDIRPAILKQLEAKHVNTQAQQSFYIKDSNSQEITA